MGKLYGSRGPFTCTQVPSLPALMTAQQHTAQHPPARWIGRTPNPVVRPAVGFDWRAGGQGGVPEFGRPPLPTAGH
jgi:hypothetical protein